MSMSEELKRALEFSGWYEGYRNSRIEEIKDYLTVNNFSLNAPGVNFLIKYGGLKLCGEPRYYPKNYRGLRKRMRRILRLKPEILYSSPNAGGIMTTLPYVIDIVSLEESLDVANILEQFLQLKVQPIAENAYCSLIYVDERNQYYYFMTGVGPTKLLQLNVSNDEELLKYLFFDETLTDGKDFTHLVVDPDKDHQ